MEQVLVVKREELDQYLPGETFITQEMSDIMAFILERYHFAPRAEAEYDKNLKQIIPYVIIQQKECFYLLRRLNKQTETRLHDRLSLGIGGHINPVEKQNEVLSIIEAGMYRELNEEVSIEKIVDLKCVGILNDTSGGVSDYHLGVVYLLQAEGNVYVRETEKMEGTWAMLPELESAFQQLETWSQIVVEKLLRFMGMESVETHKQK
jgi:predicted NUDIX family phosphoesterase